MKRDVRLPKWFWEMKRIVEQVEVEREKHPHATANDYGLLPLTTFSGAHHFLET